MENRWNIFDWIVYRLRRSILAGALICLPFVFISYIYGLRLMADAMPRLLWFFGVITPNLIVLLGIGCLFDIRSGQAPPPRADRTSPPGDR